MKKCCVCRNNIENNESAVLFTGQSGEEKEICYICEKNYVTLMESDKPQKIKEAINYLYTCLLSANDDEVASFLKETIDANSSEVMEIELNQIKNNPVDMSKKQDFFSNRQSETEYNSNESFWISGMEVFSWISFIAIIVAGIVFAIQVKNAVIGVLIFLASGIVAFLSVAVIMIFLDMARNLAEIKTILKQNKK